MQRITTQAGYTLIELMVAVGVIAVLSAIAIPAYNGYIAAGREGALISNVATIEVFEEDFKLRTGNYQQGVFDAGADADLLQLGWQPQENDGTVYTIDTTAVPGSYQVTAVDRTGTTICRQFPEKITCP